MTKNIMLCCDGTGNEYGKNNTNVVKIFALAQKPQEQICYYDPGVGTGNWSYDNGILKAGKAKDQATGVGLQKNVNDAYKFLMRNYEKGDKIYLFGFSRGAFTVRSLAGMLHKCGLLRPRLDNMLEYAAKMYNTHNNNTIAGEFKEVFSRSCPVHFIGVWDTVESLALHAGKKFHDARLNPEVSYGYHAVALDEMRKKFPPCMWEEKENIEQVWFAGVHSDVGGWYSSDTDLSDIALKWMAGKAQKHGLKFDNAKLKAIKGNPLGKQHESYTGAMWKMMGKHIRQIPAGCKVHSSVKKRIEGMQYKSKAKTPSGETLSQATMTEVEFVD